MPNTNIQGLNYSDNQEQFINKINNNFDELVELHGGVQGTLGVTGGRGPIGFMGAGGPSGVTGPRGTRWLISSSIPTAYAQIGDYWLSSTDSDIYILDPSGWIFTGYNLTASSGLFSVVGSSYPVGLTASNIGINQILPPDYLFIVSDVAPEYGIVNELLAKFNISTDSLINDAPLLELSRSDIEDGTLADYSLHPVFYWISTSPGNNSLGLKVPGSTFDLGASGGLEASFSDFYLDSAGDIGVSYGATSSSGIFSTGGFTVSASDEFNIRSKYFNITGASGSFLDPIQTTLVLPTSTTHTTIQPGGSSGLVSRRLGDSFSNLSHSTYHFSLESQNQKQVTLSTKAKLKTNKTSSGISYSTNNPGATSSIGSTGINWYFITRTGSPSSTSVLNDGNTMVINPAVSGNSYLGLALWSGSDYGWGSTGGLEPGQCIDLSIYNSSDAGPTASISGFKYIGVGTGSTASIVTKVTLPFYAKCIDLTIARGITASGGVPQTTVYYKAYSPYLLWSSYISGIGLTGGSGGSFSY